MPRGKAASTPTTPAPEDSSARDESAGPIHASIHHAIEAPADDAEKPETIPASETPSDRAGPLQIYAALLGRNVQIDDPTAPPAKDAGVEVRFKLEANFKLGGTLSPFREPRLTDKLGQWCANAIRAVDRARQRLMVPRKLQTIEPKETPVESKNDSADTGSTGKSVPVEAVPKTVVKAKPVILVGPGVAKRAIQSRAAKAHAA